MTPDSVWLLATAMFVISWLYSSVGHAGASGYIAVMSLFGLAPDVIKPTALTLNVVVASIATFQFARAGHFSWSLFWPFALLAVPLAFLGGWLNLPAAFFKVIVGFVLLFSSVRFVLPLGSERRPRTPGIAVTLPTGAGLGLLAGLTGTGGGIFLTPLMLWRGWATTKTAAAVSAAFILLNSMAGLAGNIAATGGLPTAAPLLAVAVMVGGGIGSRLGSRTLPPAALKRLLAVVLLIAGLKLILT